MDKLLYTAMTGAQQTLRAQQANSHNLANVNTAGFRADQTAFRSYLLQGDGHQTRINAVAGIAGYDTRSGMVQQTGRNLDVAVNGEGWIAVLGRDGQEAYTRAGDLRVDASGMLKNGAGHNVMGGGGPIALPPYESILIGKDGTISMVPKGQSTATPVMVDRIRLVNPPATSVARGEDGLFRMTDGSQAPADAAVTLTQGAIETSNVNATDALVNMIELQRRYETEVKLMKTAEQNDASAASLFRLR